MFNYIKKYFKKDNNDFFEDKTRITYIKLESQLLMLRLFSEIFVYTNKITIEKITEIFQKIFSNYKIFEKSKEGFFIDIYGFLSMLNIALNKNDNISVLELKKHILISIAKEIDINMHYDIFKGKTNDEVFLILQKSETLFSTLIF